MNSNNNKGINSQYTLPLSSVRLPSDPFNGSIRGSIACPNQNLLPQACGSISGHHHLLAGKSNINTVVYRLLKKQTIPLRANRWETKLSEPTMSKYSEKFIMHEADRPPFFLWQIKLPNPNPSNAFQHLHAPNQELSVFIIQDMRTNNPRHRHVYEVPIAADRIEGQ